MFINSVNNIFYELEYGNYLENFISCTLICDIFQIRWLKSNTYMVMNLLI